jgi:hypothetical protein
MLFVQAGHALAALVYRLPVDAMGVVVFLVVPAAYTEVLRLLIIIGCDVFWVESGCCVLLYHVLCLSLLLFFIFLSFLLFFLDVM